MLTKGILLFLFFLFFAENSFPENATTSCLVDEGDTWESLFPDPRERLLIQKLNRRNTTLKPNISLMIPENTTGKTLMNFSPFPRQITAPGEKLLIWDPKKLAWAAYDKNGNLVRWGPGIGGKDWCPDVERGCRTPVGTFRIIFKSGYNFRSSKYPLDTCRGNLPGRPGCARLYWFMCFNKDGEGFHGSDDMVGKNDSHGCVRVFPDDAEWLNRAFTEVGTKIVILPYV